MHDMLVKLYDTPRWNPLDRPLGVDIRRPYGSEKTKTLEWVSINWGKVWASECDRSFANDPISTYIAIRGGFIVGFACYDATAKGLFGPTGVLTGERGKGVGKALLLASLDAMFDLGYAYAVIGGVGPAEFYVKNCGAVDIPGSDPGIFGGMVK